MSASSGNSSLSAAPALSSSQQEGPKCRFCLGTLKHLFVDLGMQPLANAYLNSSELRQMEPFYPLRLFVCEHCFLVQAEECVSPERLFSHYSYFSSYSESWLRHAQAYAEMAMERFGLGAKSRVVEVASNDGYLLQHFARKGVQVLGIDPAVNVAAVAIANGVSTVSEFFGQEVARRLAGEGHQADLLVGNNVLAHVPDLNDFVGGLKSLLKPHGVLTMEFPHLMRLIDENQFDTIYHEHYSYFSLGTACRVFDAHGLAIFDVEELTTHGGSLRIYARQVEDGSKPIGQRVAELLGREKTAGLMRLDGYLSFDEKAKMTKWGLLEFLLSAKRRKMLIAGYGAPAKGNTLLNYCGVRSDLVEWTVDRSPHKQGHFLPGSHIPIRDPDYIRLKKPDYLLILPWNLKDEIVEQVSYIREWGGQFVTPIPDVRVF